VAALWAAGGAARAVEHVLNLDDEAVIVDALSAMGSHLRLGLSLDHGLDLLPTLARLVDSEYEDYLLCGLTALGTLVKCLAPTVRADADADADARGGPVDVAREERHERCVALQDGLRQTSSRLHELAAGKGRSAQLSARLLKSLEKCWAVSDTTSSLQ